MSTTNSPASQLENKAKLKVGKPQRVLACVLCQQRKVKCDRQTPCSNCVKAGGVQCVPAALAPRQRRRRFGHRQLTEQIHKYENLLKRHGIKFESLEQINATRSASSQADRYDEMADGESDQDTNHSSSSATFKSDKVYELKSFWQAMTQGEVSIRIIKFYT
jgi:hypothetical protein